MPDTNLVKVRDGLEKVRKDGKGVASPRNVRSTRFLRGRAQLEKNALIDFGHSKQFKMFSDSVQAVKKIFDSAGVIPEKFLKF